MVVVLSMVAAIVLAVSTSGVAGAATPASFGAEVTGAGLNLNLFGNKLVGGNSTTCVNSGTASSNKDVNGTATPCDSKSAPYAFAQGDGTLLTSSGLNGLATATATSPGQAVSDPSNAPTGSNCSQLSTGGPQGSNGVTVGAAVSCAWAKAAVDSGGNPSASTSGEVGNVQVDLAGILGQIAGGSPQSGSADPCNQDPTVSQTIGQVLGGVCTALTGVSSGGGGSAPAPVGGLFDGVAQALQNLYDVTANDASNDTATVTLAPALSTISEAADSTVTAASNGESVEIDLFPGVGCTAGTSLATCAANAASHLTDEQDDPTAAPLVTAKIGPSSCTATRNPSTGEWTSSDAASVVDVELNVPGDNIPLDIPGNSGTGQTIASGTPLQSTVRVSSGTAAPVGDSASCTADSLTLSLLESPTFPGGSATAGSGGAILATLGQSDASAGNAGAGAPPAVAAASGQSAPTPPPAAATAAASSPTAVHTGEWWS
ncbi:MAG: hypothetical protein ACRDV4_02545, partial [Acidimicrobiales bacterium]